MQNSPTNEVKMISIRTNKPFWRNKKFWVCPAHLPSAVIPARISQCYFSNCNALRPPSPEALKRREEEATKRLKEATKKPIQQKPTTCSMDGCSKPVASNRSKYCSDDCRKKYARKQYNIRMKMKKNGK